MRTMLRGKVTLLFMMLGLLLAVPAVALADIIVEDGDTVKENIQSPVDLGTVAPGAQVTKNASFTLQCSSAQHIEGTETLALNFNSTASKVFNSDDTAAASGSVSVVTTNPSDPPSDPLKVRFDAIPSGWPTDGNQCATTPQTLAAKDTADVTITAPNAPGTYYALAQFDHSQSGGITGMQASDISGNNEIIRYNFTVPSDTTAPTSTASATVPDGNDAGTDPDAYSSGSWTNKDVTVSLNATDNAGGSGVKELTYSATGADPISPAVTKAAANLPTSFTIDAEGTTTISYFAKDNNNNVETAKTFVVKIDKTAPTVAGALAHTADHNGWYNAPVGYTFANSSSDELSGINASSCTSGTYGDSATEVDGTGLTVSGSCSDNAGNSANGSTPAFDYDNTDPTNVTTTLDRAADHGDWYNAPVGWTTDGTDVTSDIASCDTGTYSGPDGTGKTVSGKCTDNAGNASASVASAAFDFDNTNPTQPTFSGIQAKTYAVDDLPAEGNISCSSTDVTSPPADCAVTGYSSGFGSHTLTGTATDQAGNTNSNTLAYIVGLQAGQVLSPINSASKANPLAKDLDAFKIKSTIPVKFQLYNDALMQHLMTSPPAGSTAKLSFFKYDSSTDTTDGVDVLTSGNANTGDIFRWDSMSNQYVYNLATTGKTVGTYGVQLTLYDSSNTVLAQSAKYYFVLK